MKLLDTVSAKSSDNYYLKPALKFSSFILWEPGTRSLKGDNHTENCIAVKVYASTQFVVFLLAGAI